jgi:hypothetical protein
MPAFPTERRIVNGIEFQVEVQEKKQVWVAAAKETDLQLLLYLVNGEDHAIPFVPTEIAVESVRKKQTGERRVRLHTYSPEEYERWMRNQRRVAYGMAAAAAAAASEGDARTAAIKPIPDFPTNAVFTRGSYAEIQAAFEANVDQLTSWLTAASNSLLREQEVPPHSYVGGIVHVKKKKGDNYEVTVPFGSKQFHFSFSF